MKNLLAFCLLCVTITIMTAQPDIEWQKCLGGREYEAPSGICQTNDGGYVIINYTNSNDGDVSGLHANSYDAWVVKTDHNGTIEWQKTLGGSASEGGNSVQQTSDLGYIIACTTSSNDFDVSGNHGSMDIWVVKLSSAGAIQWQKTLGGSSTDKAASIQQTTDGGYVVTGETLSNDGDVSGLHGSYDFWVVKLNETGMIEWQKTFGGTQIDIPSKIQQTSDGGYVVAGQTTSNNGDVSGFHGGTGDIWIVKLSESGILEWQKALGGSGLEDCLAMQQTNDDGFILAGRSNSNNGNVTGNHGDSDAWIIKLDALGGIEWQKSLGGSQLELGYSIDQTSDGGYIVSAVTTSTDGDITFNHGWMDSWLVKLSANGAIQWEKCFGGSSDETPYAVIQTNDHGYIVVNTATEDGGDVSGTHSYGYDTWVVKLSPDMVGTDAPDAFSARLDVFPNPSTHSISLSLPSEDLSLTARISDMTGRQVQQQSIPNGGTLDISSLPNGIYSVLATTPSGKVFSSKIALHN